MDHREIQKIQEQFVGNLWPKFLQSLSIAGLRGWNGEEIDFHFPVVAIVGENGSGKSTIAKTAACAYDAPTGLPTFFPTSFFVPTQWDEVSNVQLKYKLRHGDEIRSYTIGKPSERWSYPDNKATRPVYFLDISRTLPIDATIGYAKIAKQGQNELKTNEVAEPFRRILSHILGRVYTSARFAVSDADPVREVGLLDLGQGEVSQFHQGAGEDATLDLVKLIQSVPDTSLIIIDEVENSLHPKAQRRLTRELLVLARQKRLQIILTTHSPYVLAELPPSARVLLVRDVDGIQVIYNASTEFAMSRVDEDQHPELSVLVEDIESAIMMREILASTTHGRTVLQRIQVLPVGAANVLRTIGPPLADGKLLYAGICYLDADETPFKGCRVLPGSRAPEIEVFEALRGTRWAHLDSAFEHGAGELFAWLDEAMSIKDHHEWTRYVGDRVKLSKDDVWRRLCRQWVRDCLDTKQTESIVCTLDTALNSRPDSLLQYAASAARE
jgi:predicted ATPase